jgi:hypothetical protein
VHAALELLVVGALELLPELGQAKVAHLDVPLGVEQQVERLEVAMDDAR